MCPGPSLFQARGGEFFHPLSLIPSPAIYSPLFALRVSFRVASALSERLGTGVF